MSPTEYNAEHFLTKNLPSAYARELDSYRVAEFEKDFGGLCYQNFSGILTGILGVSYIIDNYCAHSTIGFHIIAPSGGEIRFEGSFDGENFTPIQFREISSNGYIQTTSITEDYIGSVAALRKVKFNVISGGSNNGSVVGRLSRDASTLEGIENSAPPHRFGNALFHKGVNYTDGATGNILIYSPPYNCRFVITYISFGAISTVGANITFHESPDSGVNSNNWAYSTYVKTSSNDTVQFNGILTTPFVASGMENSFYLSTDAAATIRGVVHGYHSRI